MDMEKVYEEMYNDIRKHAYGGPDWGTVKNLYYGLMDEIGSRDATIKEAVGLLDNTCLAIIDLTERVRMADKTGSKVPEYVLTAEKICDEGVKFLSFHGDKKEKA